jgi:farnesyl-diphosphate farnesyltransferase
MEMLTPMDQSELLKSVSRSFYLSLRFLPREMREPVSLGYLLARFSDTLADAPGLPEAERLVWLKELRGIVQGRRERFGKNPGVIADQLTHEGERVLVTRADELIGAYRSLDAAPREHLLEVLVTILEGQIWDLNAFTDHPFACRTAEDLLRYTYWVAGSVGEFWTKTAFTVLGDRFARPGEAAAMLTSGRRLGQALQLTNILRDLHEDLPRGRCYLPVDELKAAGWSGEGMPTAKVIRPVFERWIGVCRGFLEEADGYITELREPRVRFCTRLPRLLAGKTIDLLAEAGAERVLNERIKIPRSEVFRSAAWAVFC